MTDSLAKLHERIGPVSHEEAEELALTLIGIAFKNPPKEGRTFKASIPVEPTDTDVRLMAYIRQQKAAGVPSDGWVAVEDRLPEFPESRKWTDGPRNYGQTDPVLVKFGEGKATGMAVAVMYSNDGKPTVWSEDTFGETLHDVTHWRPLPAAPQAQPEVKEGK